jgi:hypothetical protein
LAETLGVAGTTVLRNQPENPQFPPAEERSRKEVVLFPIRIDNTVISTGEPWAVKLRDQRNIGDFRRWKTPAEYQKSLDRLLRDLKASGAT